MTYQRESFERLAQISVALKGEYEEAADEAWMGSPFDWIRIEPSRRKGKIGEQLVERWFSSLGYETSAPPNSDCDLVIESARIEVKFSTLWQNGQFKFQQIRDQEYDFVVCLGVSPQDAHMWVLPKHVLQGQPEGVAPQHGGAAGRDTLWLDVRVDAPHEWLSEYGGSLADAKEVFESLLDTFKR